MSSLTRSTAFRAFALALPLLLLSSLALAQYPAAECEPLVPAPAPDDPSVLTYCNDHPEADCDLAITTWDTTTTHRSPDVRVGDPFAGLATLPEQPRVFLDTANPAGDRLYTKLYVKFRNVGGGSGGGGFAAAGAVSVEFHYKEVADATAAEAAAADPTGWTPAGTVTGPGPTVDNTYLMAIPSPGILPPSFTHEQQRGVCWTLPAGDADFPKKFVLRARVLWPSDEDGGNDVAYSYYDLTAAGRRAQIALVLDLSGSMTLPFEGSTRLTVAREKASMFARLIEDGDQLGIFGFATGNPANSPFSTTYNSPATPSTAYADTSQIWPMQTLSTPFQRFAAVGQIQAQTAHGCTPVGQGLLRGRQEILSATPPPGSPGKAIVLFSDGEQNVRPFVHSVPAYDCGGGVASALIDVTDSFTDQGIEIYSIHFGPTLGWSFALMDALRQQTGGDFVYGAATELELAVAYFSIRGLVDDVVFLREDGTVSAGAGEGVPADDVFEVEFDAAAQVATAALAWPHGDGRTRLTLERRPQGSSEWLPCTAEEAPNNEVRSTAPGQVSSPASYLVCRFVPGADSTWELRVRQAAPRSGSTRYSAAVFSLVQTAEIHPSLDDRDFTAGQPLTIHTELRTAGQPLPGATVRAVVAVPKTSFGTVLHRHADRLSAPPARGDGMQLASLANQLGDLLASEVGSPDLYPDRGVAVVLTDDGQGADRLAGDGHYTGVLAGDQTRVAGLYEVTVTARASLAGGREVERIAKLSTIAGIAKPDPQRSVVRSVLDADLVDGARIARVTVVPMDRFGNAAFPGSGARLDFRTDGATPRGALVDNRDASYTRTFRLDREDATVTVLFDGEPVAGDVPLAGGDEGSAAAGRGRELSLHAGVAVPHGSFGQTHSNGPAFAVDYGWRLGGSFAVKAEAAYDVFDSDTGGDAELTSLAVYLQHRWSASGWQPYFEAGIGGYELDGSTAFGSAIGLGARWPLAPPWSVDVDAQHHWVAGGLGFSFTRVRLGLVYDF